MEGITSTFSAKQQTKQEASRVAKLLFFFLLLVPYGLLHPVFLVWLTVLGLLFHPDDGGGVFLQNINTVLQDHMMSHSRRQEPSFDVVLYVLCAASHQEKFLIAPGYLLPIHVGYLYLQHSPSRLASCPATLLASGDAVSGESPCDRRPIRGEYFSKLSLDLERGAAGSKRPDIPFRRGEL
jgi:hypothetical protein